MKCDLTPAAGSERKKKQKKKKKATPAVAANMLEPQREKNRFVWPFHSHLPSTAGPLHVEDLEL